MDKWLTTFVALSLVVQVVTELVQRLGLRRHTLAVAIVIGNVVAMSTGTGLLAPLGIPVEPPWLDWVWTGCFLAGRGWALDMLKKFMQARANGSGG